MGVGSGYTQKDVEELARILTGGGVDQVAELKEPREVAAVPIEHAGPDRRRSRADTDVEELPDERYECDHKGKASVFRQAEHMCDQCDLTEIGNRYRPLPKCGEERIARETPRLCRKAT